MLVVLESIRQCPYALEQCSVLCEVLTRGILKCLTGTMQTEKVDRKRKMYYWGGGSRAAESFQGKFQNQGKEYGIR